MNKAFWKALHLLTHPLTLMALCILLINDHLLRRFYPSWWTGKIGDFAWMFFIPFAVAVLLALVVPHTLPSQEKIVGLLSFCLTGIFFTLAKTIPTFHAAIHSFFSQTISYPILFQCDPTDIVALLSLFVGWKIWQKPYFPRPAFSRLGWVTLPMAAFLTIANASAPDYGINCLFQEDNHVIASATWETFTSYDGGLSWIAGDDQSDNWCEKEHEDTVTDTIDNTIQYRFFEPGFIEISQDEGQTWKIDYEVISSTQSEEAYYMKTRLGNPNIIPGPLDAISEVTTGNLILAMGHEGVLVRQPQDGWGWVPVGQYQRAQMGRTETIYTVLSGELLLALILSLLTIATLGLMRNRHIIRLILVTGTWVVWLSIALIIPPAMTYGYAATVTQILTLASVIVSVPLSLESIFRILKKTPHGTSPTKLLSIVLICAIIGAFLYILPYILWAINSIGRYYLAAFFAILLSGAAIFAGDRVLQVIHKNRQTEK
jgi:hypothetical protein